MAGAYGATSVGARPRADPQLAGCSYQWLSGLFEDVSPTPEPQSGRAASEMEAVLVLSWWGEGGSQRASQGLRTHPGLFELILAPPG